MGVTIEFLALPCKDTAMSQVFARNFLIQVVGKVLSVLIGLFTLALLTRSLGAEAFGEYVTAITFLQFFGIIVDFGLSLTLVVMLTDPGADQERITSNIFTLRMISAVILFAVAPIAVLAFPWSGAVKAGVAAGAIGYACMAGATLLVGVFQTFANVWRASVSELINRIVLFTLIFTLGSLGFGVPAMLWATTAANTLWLVVTLLYARPFVRIRPRFDRAVQIAILRRSWPMALSIFFNLIYLKGDLLILSLFRSQVEVGYYGAAYRVIDVLTAIPTIFMGLLLPALAADWKRGGHAEFNRHMARAFDAFAILFLPMVAGIQAVGVSVLRLVAGNEFAASGRILGLLAFALPGVFLGALYGHGVVAVDRQRRMLAGYLTCAIGSLIGYFFLVPRFGMTGAAAVTIASETFIAIVCFWTVRAAGAGWPSFVVPGKALLASLAMYAVLRALPNLPVLAALALGVIIYAAGLWLLGIRPDLLRDLGPKQLSIHEPK